MSLLHPAHLARTFKGDLVDLYAEKVHECNQLQNKVERLESLVAFNETIADNLRVQLDEAIEVIKQLRANEDDGK